MVFLSGFFFVWIGLKTNYFFQYKSRRTPTNPLMPCNEA